MTTSPLDVGTRFLDACATRDIDTARPLLSEDVTFESPMSTITGRDDVLTAMWEFGRLVEGITVLAAVGDAERAVLVYDMHTGPFGTLRAAEHYVVTGGVIVADQLVFDTFPIRTG